MSEDWQKKHPDKVEQLPEEEFFAILFPESVTIPGDERSRTNPGHGYPEHTVSHWRMEVYPTRAEWEAEVVRLSKQTGYSRKQFKAILAVPAQISTTVKVEVG